jgi:hypothetical protein
LPSLAAPVEGSGSIESAVMPFKKVVATKKVIPAPKGKRTIKTRAVKIGGFSWVV